MDVWRSLKELPIFNWFYEYEDFVEVEFGAASGRAPVCGRMRSGNSQLSAGDHVGD
jgi:hypothetical protein